MKVTIAAISPTYLGRSGRHDQDIVAERGKRCARVTLTKESTTALAFSWDKYAFLAGPGVLRPDRVPLSRCNVVAD